MTAAPRSDVAEDVDPLRLARIVADAGRRAGALLLCTDFDGSLAPITERPSRTAALPTAGRALARLSRTGVGRGADAACAVRVVIISGRDSADVAARVPLGPEAVVVGNYGMERTVGGRPELDPDVAAQLPLVRGAAEELAGLLQGGRLPGARLERKRCGVVLHTRGLDAPGIDEAALELARDVAGRWQLAVVPGKRAAELRLPIERDKGTALRQQRRGRWLEAALCVAGDDSGDVPMLRLAADEVPGAVTVAIGDLETPAEVFAAARWRLPGPSAWAATLARMADLLLDERVVR